MFKKSIKNLIRNPNIINFEIWKRSLSITFESENKFLVLLEPELKEILKFPSVWLRDNCYCNECFHPTSKSRKHDWEKFDVNVQPKQWRVNSKTKEIIIDWSDRHRSVYDLNWLRERSFHPKRQQHYLNDFYRPKTKHWSGQEFEKICQSFNFTDVLHNDQALKLWLESLAIYGVAIIKAAPLEEQVVRQLADRVGFIKKTTYGEEFIVQAKEGAKNVAYLSDFLPLHTDLPYYEYKPGCNLLHCLVQTQSRGGNNLLVDAFHIADLLKADHLTEYRILTQTLVDWNDIGSEEGKPFHNIWRAPVIVVDNEGNYTRINHSIPQRDSHFSVPIDEVLSWYQAYNKFVHIARSDAYAFKMQTGDVLTFSNVRLLHGRTGYDDTVENVRYIVGAYLDWDIIYSKLRVLKTATTTSGTQTGWSMVATYAGATND